jgi:hypothetical protein
MGQAYSLVHEYLYLNSHEESACVCINNSSLKDIRCFLEFSLTHETIKRGVHAYQFWANFHPIIGIHTCHSC